MAIFDENVYAKRFLRPLMEYYAPSDAGSKFATNDRTQFFRRYELSAIAP